MDDCNLFFEKKIYSLYKNLIFKQDPLSDPKTAVPRKKIKAISTPKEQLFESNCSECHPTKRKCLHSLF